MGLHWKDKLKLKPKSRTSRRGSDIGEALGKTLNALSHALASLRNAIPYPTSTSKNGTKSKMSRPVTADFPCSRLTIGAGVAIFHVATERVVLCYHTRDKYFFLPKGRRNANEETGRGAEREGFEESGYRNRLLPVPMPHRQPDDPDVGKEVFVTEPIWTELAPVSRSSQYLLHWYVAETVPQSVEERMGTVTSPYVAPERFPKDGSLVSRIEEDSVVGGFYEPVRHEGTGVDEEEALYRSQLYSIDQARKYLRGQSSENVVLAGWQAIQQRLTMERESATAAN